MRLRLTESCLYVYIAQCLDNEEAGAQLEDLEDAETGSNDRPTLSLSSSVPVRFAQPDYVFSDQESVKLAMKTSRNADASFLWALVMTLTNWLEPFYHLSNHAGLYLISNSECPDAFPSEHTPAATHTSANRRFGLQDKFIVNSMCLQCRKIDPAEADEASTDSACPYCSERP